MRTGERHGRKCTHISYVNVEQKADVSRCIHNHCDYQPLMAEAADKHGPKRERPEHGLDGERLLTRADLNTNVLIRTVRAETGSRMRLRHPEKSRG